MGKRVVTQFECGTRILRVIHGRDARATSPERIIQVKRTLLPRTPSLPFDHCLAFCSLF